MAGIIVVTKMTKSRKITSMTKSHLRALYRRLHPGTQLAQQTLPSNFAQQYPNRPMPCPAIGLCTRHTARHPRVRNGAKYQKHSGRQTLPSQTRTKPTRVTKNSLVPTLFPVYTPLSTNTHNTALQLFTKTQNIPDFPQSRISMQTILLVGSGVAYNK